jgi:cell division protein FtsB
MAKADDRRPVRDLSRPERRRAARTRRNRIVLGSSVVLSAVIVVAWFPASELLHQRQELAAASTELGRIRAADRTLRDEAKDLSSPAAIAHVAEQQYGLVAPGEQAYQVLPPSSGLASGTSGAEGSGASAASGNRANSGAARSGSGSSSSFFGRVLQTLEFWR